MKASTYHKIDNFTKTFEMLAWRFPMSRPKWGARGVFMVWEHTYVSRISGRKYTICLNYEKWFSPRVWVVEPDFTELTCWIPHVYKESANRLCLYHPRDFKWTVSKDLIQTIILWAFLWIEFFEIYLITDEWTGPEAPHDVLPVNDAPKNPHEQKRDIVEQDETPELQSTKTYKKNEPKYLKKHPVRLSEI